MTISADYAPNIDLGNGATTSFAVNFPFGAQSDLLVTLYNISTGANLSPAPVLNGAGTYDYTVSGTPDGNTGIYPNGTVIFNTAPPSTYKVVRERTTPQRQNTSLTNNAPFPAKTVEASFDRAEMQLQERNSTLTRAITAPAAVQPSSMVAPVDFFNGSKTLTYDPVNKVLISTDPSAVAAAASAAAAAVSAAQAAAAASSVNTAFRNRIINGNMRVNVRNAGGSIDFTNTKAYVLDRWYGQSTALSTQTIAGQRVTGTLAGFVNSLKFTVGGTGAAPAAGAYAFGAQVIEGVNVADLLWGTASAKPITVSFRAKASVNGNFGLTIQNSAADRSYVASFPLSAGVDTAVSLTIPGDTSGTWLVDTGIGLSVVFDLGVGTARSAAAGAWSATNALGLTGGTKLIATTGATFEVSGVQVEVGSAATAFEQVEHSASVARCLRYCRSYVFAIGENLAQFTAYSTTQANGRILTFESPMRAAPTAGLSAGQFIGYNAAQGSNSGFSSFTFLPTATGLAGSGTLSSALLVAGNAMLLTTGAAGATLLLDADY